MEKETIKNNTIDETNIIEINPAKNYAELSTDDSCSLDYYYEANDIYCKPKRTMIISSEENRFNIQHSFSIIIKYIRGSYGHQLDFTTKLENMPGFEREVLTKLSKCYGLTLEQTMMLAVIIDISGYEGVSVKYLWDHANCNFFDYLMVKKDLDVLIEKDLIVGKGFLSISAEMMYSLENNIPFKTPDLRNRSTGEIMDILFKIKADILDNRKSPSFLLKHMDRLILANPSTSIAMACHSYSILCFSSYPFNITDRELPNLLVLYEDLDSMSANERLLFYVMLSSSEDVVSWSYIEKFFYPRDYEELKSKYETNSLSLQKNEVLSNKGNSSGTSLLPNVKVNALYDLIQEKQKTNKYPFLLKADSIVEVELFYPDATKRQMDSLKKILSESNYLKVRNSMLKNGLRSGLCCIFYGDPGTGKTEGVYQLARQCCRDIIAIDFSQIRSAYVGESEKNVKEIFDDYKRYVEDFGVHPILLFNEADSILGKRSVNNSSSVSRMENSIQNIILQEMESFDGIMIATTNLVENLDNAFERRFLFKINFPTPDEDIRSMIWKKMFPALDFDKIKWLSYKYVFSGGQLENIKRKQLIYSAVYDRNPSYSKIIEWCNLECPTQSSNQSTIGYSLK